MASEYVTFADLVRFHREVIAPDLDARMDAKLSPIVGKIDTLDGKIDGVRESLEGRIDTLDGKIDGVRESLEGRIESLDGKIDGVRESLEGRIDTLDAKIDGVRESLETRVDQARRLFAGETISLRDQMESGFRAVREQAAENHRDVLSHFDQVYARLDGMSVEYTALKGGLRRVEERLTKLDGSAN